MYQNLKSKIFTVYFVKSILVILGIAFPILMILPKSRILLESSPSSIGWAELIVFFSHLIIGLSCYFIFLLFNQFNKVKIILSISSAYLFILDFDIFMYKRNWLIVAIIIVQALQLYIMSLLFKANLIKVKGAICIIIVLIGWFFVIREF